MRSVTVFLFATTVVAFILGAVWYLSPLALGFSEWPSDPARRNLIVGLYDISYRAGIPVLIVAQILAIAMKIRGHQRAALIIPSLSLGLFSLCAGTVLVLLN
ncbi:hypothetical protein AGRHK599_LOCUS4871 [Rhizobium rhizogenes]|uniref:Uncharacterized protein n=1 Tax=Rhizobium rhizogenes TaxID=359 RepID=A0AAN2AAR8_RHIRH|nr:MULTISPECIES: hypothetical protein [Rhizobium/Agrobacterium group]AQS63459.1 hypothetical protein B0909_13750 [Rhizobium rhizogenes]MCZ7441269.1 hypothetical protein [Rhizobium rhizogenes]NSZ82319.1 hypothetical protein [Agrobacterium tumefaciens]OAM62683.1 hypothetical protein A8L48_00295 [Rhizobium rhizogenes]PYG57580.1 hypothetical protein N434_03515 [Rhizobium sp. UGM030330-04]